MNEIALLTAAEAADYLTAAGLLQPGEAARVEELSGGVSSVVLLVESERRRVIIKQALPKLRVRADWPSRPDRSRIEVRAIQTMARWLPPGALPAVLHEDPVRHCFVMTAALAAAINWKTRLLAGEADSALAHQAGALLANIHLGSAADPAVAQAFEDREFFDTLRVDPYYRTVCRVHPDLRPVIEPVIEDMLAHRQALVHGDYSPKNMLVRDDRLLLLDFEVAHWGDPAFDLAFCLNHFLLKAIYLAPRSAPYFALARAFWRGYEPALAIEPAATLLPRTLLLQAGMMLARIDGKSPVEYITDERMKDQTRAMSRRLLALRPQRLDDTLGAIERALSG